MDFNSIWVIWKLSKIVIRICPPGCVKALIGPPGGFWVHIIVDTLYFPLFVS